jgi:hypothetical protein
MSEQTTRSPPIVLIHGLGMTAPELGPMGGAVPGERATG